MAEEWLNKAAVLWVLRRAPEVPVHLVATLVVVASYVGKDGRGAYCSASTVAAQTRKTERQAKRDLAELVKLGLLLPGDQNIVARFRSDRRPNVYDLPPGAVDNSQDGVTPMSPRDGHGVTPMVERGDTHGQDGVTPMSPNPVLEKGWKRPRGAASRALAAPAHPFEPGDSGLCRCGLPEKNRSHVA